MKQTLKNLVRSPPLQWAFKSVGLQRLHALYLGTMRWTKEDEMRAAFYRQFFEPDAVVFDVGANRGNRSKVFLKLGARVIAFEPQESCAEFLETAFAGHDRFTCVRKALGESTGQIDLHISAASVLSTVSEQWISATKDSGRFKNNDWSRVDTVEMTTLDEAIRQFGMPDFLKIDVEGYEYNVLKGLHQVIPFISFEFASEAMESTQNCITHLQSLSESQYQFSAGESMKFDLPRWVGADQMLAHLDQLVQADRLAWGDIYVRAGKAH